MAKKSTAPTYQFPVTLFVRHDDEDGYFDASDQHTGFDHDALVAVYQLRQVMRQDVTKTLMPIPPPVRPTPAPPRPRPRPRRR